ncbi:histidine kinase [Noviherbaspirillum cavernae]|uniref:Histidine kinase n=1 Tax=Noviherbaspirillum cavernae TaxID=2320862 RepID=A0A418WZH5_9BURK|nr:histidine kinase [Noviherbaspirillum cavernae]RJG05647.1 histidine kinase [Noviherbaspirillum cavernae]
MPLSLATFAKPPVEIVIPDCCNIGVIFRALLVANGAVLVGILLRTSNFHLGLMEFVESTMLIELSCLASLLALCGMRRAIRTIPAWGQRVACALVPAAVTGVIIHFLSSLEWLWSSFENLTALKGMLAAALLGSVLQHYFELRTRAFSPTLLEARLQALQARIRPHFLFNSLNAVLSLIRTEPRRAETTLEDLADLFRVLMRDPRSMASMEDEIRLCQQYLSIEKIRLGDRLQVEWRTENLSDEVQRKAQIPVLLLQPLLENAVHHGVEPADSPVSICVHMSRSLDRIEIVVINPYHGEAPAEAGNHMALNNIRERLALLYDVEAQLTTSVARGFFEVRLRFPFMTSS